MRAFFVMGSLVALVFITEACTPSCGDTATATNYVERAYLPDIIPYSDTSTARFLKNGKDTLIFISQGLKEIFESGSSLSSDCQKSYKNQVLSLKMTASDTDFFEIIYTSTLNNVPIGKFNFRKNNSDLAFYYTNFRRFYPPIINVNILNTQYDTVNVFPIDGVNNIYFKPNIGIIKISTPTFTYELIK